MKFNFTAIMHITICQKPGSTHHAFNTISVSVHGDDSITRQVMHFLVSGAERREIRGTLICARYIQIPRAITGRVLKA